MAESSEYIACSSCFSDQGLRLVVESLGSKAPSTCPNCAATDGVKLTKDLLLEAAHRFFVWGSFSRVEYGGAPLIQFNDLRSGGEVEFPQPLLNDAALIENLCGISFFSTDRGYGCSEK